MTNEPPQENKSPYQTPELTEYGTLATTTQAGVVSAFDVTSVVA
jgi:hypothetical protein